MRYAIEVVVGDQTRLAEVVEVPPGEPDAPAWLAKHLPTISGFIRVADDNVGGAVKQGNGSYLNPSVSAELKPVALSKTAFNKLGWAQVGMPRHQAILEAAKAHTGTTDLDYEVRAAYQQYDAANDFEKSEVKSLSDLLIVAGIMTADEQSKYMTGWPTT